MHQEKTYGLIPADLDWLDGDVPYSKAYQDIYFHREHGLDETRFVFLQGNRLEERFADSDSFVVGELGFGTGLNFLATWKLWKEKRKSKSSRLHYLSIEKSPLTPEDIARAMRVWPELEVQSQHLVQQYPSPVKGYHRVLFEADGVTLTLLFGEALSMLKECRAKIDAWFCDGFAPDKNPELWTTEIASQLRRVSAPHATFATYSSAGHVRRAFQEAGFSVRKTKGFLYKREMVVGELPSELAMTQSAKKKVAVIGGGIAGCSVAYALAERGVPVTLFEKRDGVAQQASGNLAAVLMPQISKAPNAKSFFSIASYLYAVGLINELQDSGHQLRWSPCGVVRVPGHQQLLKVLQHFEQLEIPNQVAQVKLPSEVSDILGINVSEEALYFSIGGSVSPSDFCQAMIQQSSDSIEIVNHQEVLSLEQTSTGWKVNDQDFTEVVITNSYDAKRFVQTQDYPLNKVRGQVAHLPPQESLGSLDSVLCHTGYLTPLTDGMHMLGASFEHNNNSEEVDQKTQRELIEKARQLVPELSVDENEIIPGRVSFRCTTPDKLPLVGWVPNRARIVAELDSAKYTQLDFDGKGDWWHQGLYLSVGHGSHGISMAPLCGELIASQICDEPLPLPFSLVSALNPLRFIVRDLNQKKD